MNRTKGPDGTNFMQTPLKLLAALIGAGLLTGCASSPKVTDFKIVPKTDVRHSDESANGYYKLGRYYHAAQRLGDAAAAYRRALALDNNHLAARNALGILLAETGQPAQGVALLREATEAAPRDSQLFSNLGYALLLARDFDGAAAALDKATSLDPGNARAWNNYGRVMEKLGRPAQAQVLFSRARSVVESKVTAPQTPPTGHPDRLSPPRTSPEASQPERGAEPAGRRPNNGMRTEIWQVGPSMYELRQVLLHPAGGSAPSQATASPPDAPLSRATTVTSLPTRFRPVPSKALPQIEISNGNGITGMARSLGKLIAIGYPLLVRVTNHNPFDVKNTCIEYSDGHEELAHALATDLGGTIQVKASEDLPTAGVRLLLGKDLRNLDALREYFSKRLAADEGHSTRG